MSPGCPQGLSGKKTKPNQNQQRWQQQANGRAEEKNCLRHIEECESVKDGTFLVTSSEYEPFKYQRTGVQIDSNPVPVWYRENGKPHDQFCCLVWFILKREHDHLICGTTSLSFHLHLASVSIYSLGGGIY